MRVCWICGAPAVSSEHILKRDIIAAIFGPGPYTKGSRLVKTSSNGRRVFIQSPASQHLTFVDVLCCYCNNSKTQSFDRAFERLMRFALANTEIILTERRINLRSVYTDCRRENQENLVRYFAKLLGCALTSQSLTVPDDLIAACSGSRLPKRLEVTFAIFGDMLNVSRKIDHVLEVNDLFCIKDSRTNAVDKCKWAVSFGWLTIVFWYDWDVDDGMGDTWHGTRPNIGLGEFGVEEC